MPNTVNFTLNNLAALKRTLTPAWSPTFTFLVLTGLHLREARDIKWSDVKIDEGYVLVYDARMHRNRVVRLLPLAIDALMSQKSLTGSCDFVFSNPESNSALRDLIPDDDWYSTLRLAGCPPVPLKTSRSWFKRLMQNWEEDSIFISRQLGGKTQLTNEDPFRVMTLKLRNQWKTLDQQPAPSGPCMCQLSRERMK